MSTPITSFCPDTLYLGGVCTTEGCELLHDAKLCEPCSVICSPATLYQNHVESQQHRDLISDVATAWLFCPACNLEGYKTETWQQHIRGARHRNAAAQQGLNANVAPMTAAGFPGSTVFCAMCKQQVPKSTWAAHSSTYDHRRREVVAAYKATFEEAERDKQGVEVRPVVGGLDFEIVELAGAQHGVHKTLVIRSTSALSRLTIVDINVSAKPSNMPCPFRAATQGGTRAIYNQGTNIVVTLRHDQRGRYAGRIEIVFENESHRRFVIIREVRATIGEAAEHDALKATTPYVKPQRVPWRRGQVYHPGQRPPALDAVPWTKPLGPYLVPQELRAILSGYIPSDAVHQVREKLWPRALDAASHGRLFKLLLWIEEYRMEHDLRAYDLGEVSFARQGHLYYLTVPGLAEKRPSVVVGDQIEVQPSERTQAHCFEGWVHVVRLNDIGLGFHPSFRPTAGQRFNVRFKMNRIPLRRQHQALAASPPSPNRFLFPLIAHVGLTTAPNAASLPIVPFNPCIAGNAEQLQAIRSILQVRKGAAPFIIFGPPGTGKTVTLVETIRQILARNKKARILACAPSNSAADILARRLNSLSNTELFRFYAVSRRRELVPDDLLGYTYMDGQGHFSVPQVADLATFRVIISTCGSASFAYGVGLPPGHFTHIFIDEAGQATEAETMTAMKTITTPSTQLVLCGDPKQLGPIITSSVARELGMGVSFLERLMERDVYNERLWRGRTLVKLVQNFRSHRAILTFSNEQFYNSDLQACGPARVIDSFIGWTELPNRKFPIIFHAVSGKDERQASSPSYFNLDEVLVGRDYIRKLKSDRRFTTSDEEIGVITPYNAQARKFREALKFANIGTSIKVASVEEFQGDERKVIMLSTVRSSKELLTFDAKYTLGFVANPRRLNVAITRAKALLIVIGDPFVLSIDPLWRRFLNYVALNNGWRGIPISWDPHAPVHDGGYENELREQGVEDITDFMQRMQNYLGDDDQSAHDIMEGQINADGVWRERE